MTYLHIFQSNSFGIAQGSITGIHIQCKLTTTWMIVEEV